MSDLETLDSFRDQLSEDVANREIDLSDFNPLNISPWLAMSLMQKAIRRGRDELALRAAATLLHVSPDRLWRRLCVTAFEDIGVADLVAELDSFDCLETFNRPIPKVARFVDGVSNASFGDSDEPSETYLGGPTLPFLSCSLLSLNRVVVI